MSTKAIQEYIWDPMSILKGKNIKDKFINYAVLILNTEIKWNSEFLLPIWEKATIRYTVDGGTNRWFSWLEKQNIDKQQIMPPHFVSGDMDSIYVKVLQNVRDQHQTQVIVTEDQNATDFTKALIEMQKSAINQQHKIQDVIAVVDSCGRFDQICANIDTLYKAKSYWPNLNIYQLASDSLTWLITPGMHKIYIPEILRTNHAWCALIPIGDKCTHVTTTGLKWNLDNQSLKFGELISTSNTYDGSPFVTIEIDKTILWSMSLNGVNKLTEEFNTN